MNRELILNGYKFETLCSLEVYENSHLVKFSLYEETADRKLYDEAWKFVEPAQSRFVRNFNGTAIVRGVKYILKHGHINSYQAFHDFGPKSISPWRFSLWFEEIETA